VRTGAGRFGAVVACCAAIGIAAGEASAAAPPEKDWEVEIAPYGWLALAHGRIETARFGDEEFTIDADEVIESLDLGAMGAVKARWRRFVFVGDVAWAKLSDDGGLGDTLVRYDVTQKLGWFEALAGYRVYERAGGLLGTPSPGDTRRFGLDLLGGLVYSWLKVELDLSRDPLAQIPPQERSIDRDADWVAPYLALRFHDDFTARLRHETLLGIGGFGVGDAPHVAWQATSLLSYAITEHWLLTGGYRALGGRYPDLHTTFHGPIVGLGFRF
jgi:hypothetical protein